MILAFAAKGKKTLACMMLVVMYVEAVIPAYALGARKSPGFRYNGSPVEEYKDPVFTGRPAAPAAPRVAPARGAGDNGGPTQPEMQGFHSVNNDNMVDLFSGDFSYNIPLLDVGGYPITIGYNSGVSMDQEASWTGLGWNINPGTISRNLRGIPDDFNGQDSIAKTAYVKENKTIGVTSGMGIEIGGGPIGLSWSLGLFHNTYRGWGVESGINPSINAGAGTSGSMSLGLSLTNNSQEGLTLSPSLSLAMAEKDAKTQGGMGGMFSVGLSYNSRSGMKALEFSGGIRQFRAADAVQKDLKAANIAEKKWPDISKQSGSTMVFTSGISYVYPSYTPSISLPFTSSLYTAMVKVGTEIKSLDPNFYIGGYVTKQYIAKEDTIKYLPAYGYLNFQKGATNPSALMDFNREREIAYREKPEFPNIAVPGYTYDVFSMTGEGTGGTFRAYRSDIGYAFDHQMRTKDASATGNVDLGFGDIFHVGVDISATRAFTETGAWKAANPMANTVRFTQSDKNYEAVYFRNPGEKTVNTTAFYDAIGGDDVVYPKLTQAGNNSPAISTTNSLVRFKGGKKTGEVKLTAANATKKERDKRTQVISYLNAEEASVAGFPKYIESYGENQFLAQNCENDFPTDTDEDGTGLKAEYFAGQNFEIKKFETTDGAFDFPDLGAFQRRQPYDMRFIGNNFSIRWTGRIKAPVTGQYTLSLASDDGAKISISDSSNFIWRWYISDGATAITKTLNLEAGKVYDVTMEYYNNAGKAKLKMDLACGSVKVTAKDMYWPTSKDVFEAAGGRLSKEKRVNSFRKKNHISQVDVLNSDGRRYIYGLPVYNLKQKDVTFAVKNENGDPLNNTVAYDTANDVSTRNRNGNDHYYSSEETPAYAHSFLLTGILSPDYVDATGDGISDDDPGDAIKFNYTKTAGVKNPFKWRTPHGYRASYNEGLKTDTRDDKGSYVYGEKELWYLNSVESKSMIATFILEDRNDIFSVSETGKRDASFKPAKRLAKIHLYTKADFLKNPSKARPVKTVNFDYEEVLCRDSTYPDHIYSKLTLKRIWFSYNGNNKGRKNAYVFNYNSKNPNFDHKSYDRWGNYKDPLQNPGSTVNNLITNAEYPYALQDSALAAENAAAWALDSIVLPSGGRIKVTYESDDYAFVQNKRAAQMFKVAGFSSAVPSSLGSISNELFGGDDHLYLSIHVSDPVHSNREIREKYLEGMDKLYFRLNVKMPSDKWGKGYDFVSGYAKLEPGTYGYFNDGKTIWVKLVSVDKGGLDNGEYSPLAKTAAQFVRLNLPSKAYPGSDIGDNLDFKDGIQMIFSMGGNIINAFRSYDASSRASHKAREVDLARSYVRLNNPVYKKYGGGHRVKKVVIHDNWNKMTGQKESQYGTEYQYTTTKNINGRDVEISSGVATYEPMMGGEENPWRMPLEYREQVAALAPVTMGYVETPLGESFFPGASVGYSKVRTRSIKIAKTRSANGFEETSFYTAYDFPVITEHSLLNNETKLRYKPTLASFLKINATHHMVLSQGFKVELNDMHGKLRSKAIFPETDRNNPISYSGYYYHVDNLNAETKHLSNNVLAMNAQGVIDSTSIGKDAELMMDMRQQLFISNAVDFNANGDVFTFGLPPILGYPSFWVFPHRQENLFRSAAATKVISRHGILDSVVAIEKGSKIVTANLLYDSETGDPILTSTLNEHDDTIYNFTYPAGWVYDGMSGAYKNINTVLDNVNFKEGRIVSSLGSATAATYFASGDELLIYSRNSISGDGCSPQLASFRSEGKIWAVDANAISGGAPDIFFMDESGKPYTGSQVNLKIIRSGRKNIAASVGTVTMMVNPLVKNGTYQLKIDKDSKILNAQMVEYKQNWQVEDKKKEKVICLF